MMKDEAYRRWHRRYYARTAFAPNHRKPWSESDERTVMRHELPDRELSRILGRSVNAIQHKRRQLKAAGYDSGD